MAYQSLYRKYRSQSFDDLIGQDHVVRTLQSAIERGRIAHAYLFTGPRGTGKTSTARLLAKALECEKGPTPCPDGTCEICRDIAAGTCVDVIEIDAASESGVDDIRETIVDTVEYRPVVARYKVFIIDEVHDLSAKAFDALLKTIEEPPEHVVFILATTEFHKVPTTVRSRCQKYDFHRATMGDLTGRLAFVAKGENVEVEPEALSALARMADGGYRDALTLLEQAILTAPDGRVTLAQVYDQLGLVSEETVDAILMAVREGDVPAIMAQLGEVQRLGRDPSALLESMMHRLADLTRASYGVEMGAEDAAREASLHETAVRIGRDTILRLRGAVAGMHDGIRDISLPRVWLESEFIRLAGPPPQPFAGDASPRRESPAAGAPVARPESPIRPVTGVVSTPSTVSPVVPQGEPSSEPEVASPTPILNVPALTGDAALDAAATAWTKVKAALGAKSALMEARLETGVVTRREGSVVMIQMDRQMDVEWVQEGTKRAPAILDAFRTEMGDAGLELKYVPKRKEIAESNEAVEIPLEGSRLDQLVKDTFGEGAPGEPPANP